MSEELGILQLANGDNFSYLVFETDSREALCIDPSNLFQKIKGLVNEKGLDLKYIFLTHHHYDHTGETLELTDWSRAPIIVHYREEDSQQADIRVRDGDSFEIGDVEIETLYTPGHTRGGMCIKVGNNIFTGDTVFVGDVGRIDLPGGSAKDMYTSLNKIKQLSDDIMLYPGHDYGEKPFTSLKEERERSSYLNASSIEELARLIREGD